MRDFDRSFNRTRNGIKNIFGITVIAILLFFGGITFLGVKVTSNPEGAAETVGKFGKSLKEGFEKGYKVEVSEDTIVVDTLNVK